MAEAGTDTGGGMLAAYRLVGRLALPALKLLHARRVRRGKEDPARRGERFGQAALVPEPGPRVWVHAASVGETNAVLPLIEWIVARGFKVVLTTGTITSSRIAAERLPEGAVHQFAPFDVAPLIARFLDSWKPEFAVMVESEIWPATFAELHARKIPVVIVNGRMSEGSHRGWSRFGRSARRVFGCVTMCLAQSQADAERYADLGIVDVRATGNLKFDVPPLPFDERALDTLRDQIGARPVWIAASTHPGEEEMLASIHKGLRERFPDLLLISVPRHPERGPDVADIFASAGLDPSLRSRGEPIQRRCHVYVADTIGELGLFYRLAPIAFIGGSLVPHGGQNPIEPAQIGCAILSGARVRNFSGIYRSLTEAGAARVVKDAEALQVELAGLLGNHQAVKNLASAAKVCADSGQGALDAVKEVLERAFGKLLN